MFVPQFLIGWLLKSWKSLTCRPESGRSSDVLPVYASLDLVILVALWVVISYIAAPVPPSFSLELLIQDRIIGLYINWLFFIFVDFLLHSSTSIEAMWPCNRDSTLFDTVVFFMWYNTRLWFHSLWTVSTTPSSQASQGPDAFYTGVPERGRSLITSIIRPFPAVMRAAHFLPPPVSVGDKYELFSTFAVYSTQVRGHHAEGCFTVLRSPPRRGPARPL